MNIFDDTGYSYILSSQLELSLYKKINYAQNILNKLDILQMDNKKLFVFGTCIDSLELFIFDRWGEVVFETTAADSRTSEDGDCCIFGSGWDGSFKNTGDALNSANFAYILQGKYKNGEAFNKSGNIILK